jgi:hypothetical protein
MQVELVLILHAALALVPSQSMARTLAGMRPAAAWKG